ncbi:hypothetical protein HZI73_02010 [Vallitalea pronyensis]|uniref:Pyruvate kinase n=1 Tax=Vallitalea pronyensis TaxID=1348613 RepID=A0A8J8MGF7_9FIRM|nr:pyruvate kinase [Vallitalea pronyensis]QUI21135.1 hypothetical protein HZI73_02010 [Vallitalea pronyensis]
MIWISEKVIVTLRKYDEDKDMTKLLNKVDELYALGIRRYRFNLGKLSNKQTIEDTFIVIKKMKSLYGDIRIMVDLGYPGTGVRFQLPADEKKRKFSKDEVIFFISTQYSGQEAYNTLRINAHDLRPLFTEGQLLYYRDGDVMFRVVSCISQDKVSVIPLMNIKIKANAAIKCGTFIKDHDTHGMVMSLVDDAQPEEIALSFVENPKDILALKKELTYSSYKIISKIETTKGLLHLDDIIDHSHGIMLARGDLAFNSPLSDFYYNQSKVIRETRLRNKDIYVATDILSSYCKLAFPSRSDVIDLGRIIAENVSGIILNGNLVSSQNFEQALHLIEDMYIKFAKGLLVYDCS